ncbi:plastocyanin/azurin family copper-binding protein [Piscinibacter sp. XHJ-5]|uniref:cupredoxin domain-containing protein n=1 Tax=Piscinibacter sp. XHJ-5 TaxID=3037797 RepID=UPI002452DF51|nr:plastocyanin/azurin family copper-binding protein [Piscinibacter sp. XHJ-5]
MNASTLTLSIHVALALFSAASVSAADHSVVQRNKAFAVRRLVVNVGDTIKFVNLDDVPHNAFSLANGNVFDTGMLTKGNSKDITFTKSGIVEVECAVHPLMTMTVEVRP